MEKTDRETGSPSGEGHSNGLATFVNLTNRLPGPLGRRLLTLAIGKKIKFLGHAGIKVVSLTPERVELVLENKKKVQNHIGTLHAAAMALLAESATGIIVGLNVSDQCIPVIKSMHIDYLKRTKGGMRAVATLSREQVEAIQSVEKGELTVETIITDDSGGAPIAAQMVWAWIPKRR